MQHHSTLRRLLDALLGSRWSIILPAALAAAMCLLHGLFGLAPKKPVVIGLGLMVGVFCFFGVFAVVGFQARRMKDAALAARFGGLLTGFTLLVMIALTLASLGAAVRFLGNIHDFQPDMMVGPTALAGLAWAHQQRRD